MFAPYQGRWGIEDLVSEGLMAARAQWPKYDRARSAASTFLYQRARSRIYDILRGENRRQKRDHIACELRPEVQPAPPLPSEDPYGWNPETPLEDWFASTYRASRSFYIGPQHRRGRRACSAAHMAAIGMLAVRLKLSSRGCKQFLTDRQDLRQAIGLKQVPTHVSIWSATRAARTFYNAQCAHLLTNNLRLNERDLLTEKPKAKVFFAPARRAG